MLASALSSFAVSFLCGLIRNAWTDWAAARVQKAQGRAEAVAEARGAALERTAEAGRSEAETAKAHGSDASDAAFDADFMRRI